MRDSQTQVGGQAHASTTVPVPVEATAWPLLALLLVLLLVGLVRWRFFEVPLDRDTGEFAYIGQQMLRGVPPYESGYAMKWPGIYVAYAGVMYCFGETVRGIQVGFALVNLADIVLVFLVARRMCASWTAVAAAAMFGLMSLDRSLQGSTAQAEHFVLLPALAGVWLLLARPSTGGAIGAGLMLGLAAIVKQHGFGYGLFGAWYLTWRHWGQPRQVIARCGALAVGVTLPITVVLAAMQALGVLDPFWFFTVSYASHYAAGMPFWLAATNLKDNVLPIVLSQPLVVALAVAGTYLAVLRSQWIPVALFCFSFLGIIPGGWFWPHYFVLVLPALAILAASTLGLIAGSLRLSPASTAGMAAGVVLVGVILNHRYLLLAPPQEVSRLTYFSNPFPEAVEVSNYLLRHAQTDDSIAVLGSEPEIYFYTARRAISRHIYTYPLTEPQPFASRMQHELAADVERARPDWIVFENPDRWTLWSNSERWIVSWAENYLDRYYQRVGVVDVQDQSVYRFHDGYRPVGMHWLEIYRRREPSLPDNAPASPHRR